MRRAITGGPKTGKSTAHPNARCTDDAMHLGWSECSETVSRWFDGNRDVEGVAVPRALRKWLDRNPTGKPVDEVVIYTRPHERLSTGQVAMSKGIDTVMREIEPELKKRGVRVVRR